MPCALRSFLSKVWEEPTGIKEGPSSNCIEELIVALLLEVLPQSLRHWEVFDTNLLFLERLQSVHLESSSWGTQEHQIWKQNWIVRCLWTPHLSIATLGAL